MSTFRVLVMAGLALTLEGVPSVCPAFDLSQRERAVVFEDNFETAVLDQPVGRWAGVSPGWKVASSNRRGLLQSDTRPVTRQILYRPGTGWRDYSLRCLVRVAAWGGQTKNFSWDGLQHRRVYWSAALRVTDAADGYLLEYCPWVPEEGGQKQSFYRLVKFTNGERTELARCLSRFHSDLDWLVRFEAEGSELRAKIWPAGSPEPEEWVISARDSDHPAGTLSFLTANVSMLFGDIQVEDAGKGRKVLLKESFRDRELPPGWEALSGDWSSAAWGNCLARAEGKVERTLVPASGFKAPARLSVKMTLGARGRLVLPLIQADGKPQYNLSLDPGGAELNGADGARLERRDFTLEPGADYSLGLDLTESGLALSLAGWPLPDGSPVTASFKFPRRLSAERIGFCAHYADVSLDDLVLESETSAENALKEYLRYICDWYMRLDLPGGYPKTGTGTPELFIAAYCARTLMAGARILDEPAYLEEALRWADFVTGSPSVLVPVVTGQGREALALRSFADWSACINLADIGSVLTGVELLYPRAGPERQARYLEVLEKYSRYVIEGCIEDPLRLGRGNQPQGWRVSEGPDKGGFSNGYWWMTRADTVWDISTTNVGLDFYSLLYGLTGNDQYASYAREAAQWYLAKQVDTGGIFEDYDGMHDVIYGGEALIIAWEHSADRELKVRIEAALGKICGWVVEQQNADGTWNKGDTPRNNRTCLLWYILDWYGRRHPENQAVQAALDKSVAFYLSRENSRYEGVCEVLRKTCFLGVSVAELLRPGSATRLER